MQYFHQNTGSVNMSLVIWILSGVFSMVSRKYFFTNTKILTLILILILSLILIPRSELTAMPSWAV